MRGRNSMLPMDGLSDTQPTSAIELSTTLQHNLFAALVGGDYNSRGSFRGSIDDWIRVGGPAPLDEMIAEYTPHLGQESFYELM